MTTQEKEKILKMMKQSKLPEFMIEEFEATNNLPINTNDMTHIVKSLNKVLKVNTTLETIGYNEEVQKNLCVFYELLSKN